MKVCINLWLPAIAWMSCHPADSVRHGSIVVSHSIACGVTLFATRVSILKPQASQSPVSRSLSNCLPPILQADIQQIGGRRTLLRPNSSIHCNGMQAPHCQCRVVLRPYVAVWCPAITGVTVFIHQSLALDSVPNCLPSTLQAHPYYPADWRSVYPAATGLQYP